jgi:hypothetical protein
MSVDVMHPLSPPLTFDSRPNDRRCRRQSFAVPFPAEMGDFEGPDLFTVLP